MRKVLTLALVLCSGAAFAQDKPPPTVGGKPLVQVKPKDARRGCAKRPRRRASRNRSRSGCRRVSKIDDETKERLNCYDGVFPPKPKPKAPALKGVNDCAAFKEEDERLKCFNGFTEKIPKLPR